jgi:hypothetical protein
LEIGPIFEKSIAEPVRVSPAVVIEDGDGDVSADFLKLFDIQHDLFFFFGRIVSS